MFDNSTAEAAANQRNQGLQAGYDNLSNLFGSGREALGSAYGIGRDVVSNAYGQGRGALATDYSKARDALSSGYGQAGSLYAGLGDYFNNLYGGGATAYGDATGANGPEGYARAISSFKADPGYGFQLDQGLQALQRTHAAAGNLSSGNADADTLKFSQGLADQSYGNYVSRLAPYLQLAGTGATTAAAGRAGAATGLATGLSNVFQGEGGLTNTSFQGEGGLTNASLQGQGGAVNTSLQGQGTAANANFTGQGASNAAATMNNYNVGANQLSALMAAGKLGASLFGGF